ncbi:hypothetical protein QTH87_05625 [Variovorax sp. J22P168]|uniref:hypothetical protein n=1 Tax=Variovorax jilinensis TaxID=3053513 RepID=UPI002575FF21|nr:hypothetical protein [Variovorax sp. J22P168]MDM0011916.1 hypothetical protein [Variovorax sp. J22P168]
MRLLSFIVQLSMFWIPMAVALLTIGYAFYLGSVGMGVFGVIFVLVLGLGKAIMIGAAGPKK